MRSELTIEEIWERLERRAWRWNQFERTEHWDDSGFFYKPHPLFGTRFRIYYTMTYPNVSMVNVLMKEKENGTELELQPPLFHCHEENAMDIVRIHLLKRDD